MTIGPDISTWPRRFSVLGPLMGGFGSQAFLGCDHATPTSPRPAVMVFLPDAIVGDASLFESILQETEIAAHIDHPNVMSVIGLARIDEGYARIVEYADGESLMALFDRLRSLGQAMPLPMTVQLVASACSGVHYAHELGRAEIGTPLIHAAVRPSTLIVGYKGITKVTGYGAAVLAEGLRLARGEHTQRADPYTAPEQVLGGRNAATVQTDVYGLGAVLFELLVGAAPPPSDWPTFEHQVEGQLRASPVAQEAPEALLQVVLRALRRRAADRFVNVLAMREALLTLGLSVPREELATFMESLFGAHFPSRIARQKLLDNLPLAVAVPSLMLSPRTDPSSNSSIPPRANLDDFEEASASALQMLDAQGRMLEAPIDRSREAAPLPLPFDLPVTTTANALPQKSQSVKTTTDVAASAVPTSPPVAATAPQPPPPPSYVPPPPPTQVVVYKTSPLVYVALLLVVIALVGVVALLYSQGAGAPSVAEASSSVAATAAEGAAPPKPTAVEPAPPPPPDDAQGAVATLPPAAAKSATQKISPQKNNASSSKGPGTLEIESNPEMALFVDGKSVGQGATSVEVKPGKHVVKGSNKEFGVNVTRRVSVTAGKVTKVSPRANKGGLIIDAPAGSVVFVDGKKVGSIPGLDVIDLYEGQHKVLVKNGAAQYRHTVPIRAGLDTTLTVNFLER
ncbi:MAG: protein kinase domain-containing protein [Myxococcota bacterium]